MLLHSAGPCTPANTWVRPLTRPDALGSALHGQRETSFSHLRRAYLRPSLLQASSTQTASPGRNRLDQAWHQQANTPGPGCRPQLGRAHGPLPSAGSPTNSQGTRGLQLSASHHDVGFR
ncbi:hypothetical protein NDU88_009883 [Pleurodeles waltl]|uniref:Uncharacterized protein n=1 Tax=Pleurodeles waltl TaxID=8319 RepID=A0AAV7QWA3_PLEWA|nr:hypothetical protein NDU88_009883 [Pleurodeles waltl]